MKFVLAAHGTRGDVEPCVTVGVELRRRGHEVRMAVPPNLVGFVESAGLSAVAYGPDTREQVVAVADFTHNAFKIQNPVNLLRDGRELFVEGWAEMSRTLTSLADGADLLLTGQTYHGVVANVAEYYDIPVSGLHHFPVRVNGQIGLPFLPSPAPAVRSTLKAGWWLYSHTITKANEDAQRRELGLPTTAIPAGRRMAEGGTLEIQAYDQAVFPGLAAEWNGRRPFVGALTLELGAHTDDEVASWIAAGTPPIYFGFGSTPVQSPADTVAMISEACAELGERALIYSGTDGSEAIPHADHVKLVGPGQLHDDFAPVPRGRSPWWRWYHRCESARRPADADPLGCGRPVHLGDAGQTAESRLRQAPFEHHPKIAGQQSSAKSSRRNAWPELARSLRG